MFGERLKELREDKKIKQEDLATILNIARSTVGEYERNKNEPSLAILINIADYFNVSLDYLLGRTKEKYNLNLLDKPNKELILKLYDVVNSYTIKKK